MGNGRRKVGICSAFECLAAVYYPADTFVSRVEKASLPWISLHIIFVIPESVISLILSIILVFRSALIY